MPPPIVFGHILQQNMNIPVCETRMVVLHQVQRLYHPKENWISECDIREHWTHLSSNCMTSGREKFGDTCCFEASLCKTEGSSQSSTPCTTEVKINSSWYANAEKITHTTTASYSCSMRGYFPNPKDCTLGEWKTKDQDECDGQPGLPGPWLDSLRQLWRQKQKNEKSVVHEKLPSIKLC